MNTPETIKNVSQFLFGCIEGNKPGSFAIIEHGESSCHYFQFFVCGNGDDKANGELHTQVVGVKNSESQNPECSERFNKLLKSGWNKDDYGNAEQVYGSLTDLKKVSCLVKKTMNDLIAVYQVDSSAGWNIELNEEGN